MLLLFLTTIFSGLSVCMMSYLAMNTQMGPWIAPVFIVVCMMLAIPLVSRRWFEKHAIVTIAAGSIGGMIGGCLGTTVPSFYFLHESIFLEWMETPFAFAGMLGLLVLCAGSVSFVVAHFMKDYLIVEKQLPFPMSALIYDIVAIDREKNNNKLVLAGVGLASVWNFVTLAARTSLQLYAPQIHLIPLMLSVGFVAGELVAVPVFFGLVIRIVSVKFLHHHFFASMLQKEFLVTFCVGMLLAVVVKTWLKIGHNPKVAALFVSKKIKSVLSNRKFVMLICMVVLLSGWLLHVSGVPWYAQLYVIPILIASGLNVALIVAEIGVVDLDSFVWFVILPFVYHSTVSSSISVLVIAVFATLCLGMIADLMFSYKLAHLASIPYRQILRYQILGFAVAVLSAGFVMWWYVHTFGLDSMQLLAPQAHQLDSVIRFGVYNYRVLLCGFVSGWIVSKASKDAVAVIGATLIVPSIAIWLIIAGFFTYFIRKPEKYFPLSFGVYGAHSLWIMIRAVIE